MVEIGEHPSEVQWTSQLAPASPFDIRTLRCTPNGIREHFLEVKSSASISNDNVYVSARQITFFEEHRDRATFALVRFDAYGVPSVRELTIAQLRTEFELEPIKYRLALGQTTAPRVAS